MADLPYGVSFAPTSDNALNGPKNGSLAGVPEAIQVLSFHIPRILGAKPIAPAQLLNGQGGQGMDPFAMVTQTLLAALAKQQLGGGLQPSTASPFPTSPTIPGPSFTPGTGPGTPQVSTPNPFTPSAPLDPLARRTTQLGGGSRQA